MSALDPFRPTADHPWDGLAAAHLLNRATFAPLPADISNALANGLEKTVDALLAAHDAGEEDSPPETPELPDHPRKDRSANLTPEQRKQTQDLGRTNRESIEGLRSWWIGRMLHSEAPLHEKLTLFWHGHFTTSEEDVKGARLILKQNEFLRKNCLADFHTLVLGISRDPAMLRYLDNNTNRRQHPNENYARELMELFTLGIGNYTEDDVKAAARAFTGWTFEDEEFVFHRFEHDDGVKTFLGETGRLDGIDILDIILKQPCTARFMATKLLKFFVTDKPEPPVVEEVAAMLRAQNYEFKPVLRALFTSDYFFSHPVYRSQFKSPVQLVVGSVRLVNATIDGKILAVAMKGLGQDLFYPPNVKGWDGGETWINTTTLLLRYNFAGFLLGGQQTTGAGETHGQMKTHSKLDRYSKPKNELNTLVGPDLPNEPVKLVDVLIARLLQTKLDAKARQWLVDQAETTRVSERATRVAHLIMSMPDYQLC